MSTWRYRPIYLSGFIAGWYVVKCRDTTHGRNLAWALGRTLCCCYSRSAAYRVCRVLNEAAEGGRLLSEETT